LNDDGYYPQLDLRPLDKLVEEQLNKNNASGDSRDGIVYDARDILSANIMIIASLFTCI
jgi:hypothetical protein